MKALILDGQVVEVSTEEFDAHPDYIWVDCPDTTERGNYYVDGVFSNHKPTPESIQTYLDNASARVAARASGNQKLLDLGLTQEEATALTGYTPV